MKRITRLTERDLTRIAKKVVKEYWYEDDDDAHDEYVDERDEQRSRLLLEALFNGI